MNSTKRKIAFIIHLSTAALVFAIHLAYAEARIPTDGPLRPAVTISYEPNRPSSALMYYPSQAMAMFPQRLQPGIQSYSHGIAKLAPDCQEPIDGGIRFLSGSNCSFMIHHRRAGALCRNGAVFTLRMESFQDLATVGLAVRENGRLFPLTKFEQRSFCVFPGRVRYQFESPELMAGVQVEAVSPVAVPAYGVIVRVEIKNESNRHRTLQLLALAAPGAKPGDLPASDQSSSSYIKLDTPRVKGSEAWCAAILHDPHYSVLVGWNGNAAESGGNCAARTLVLSPKGSATGQLTVLIDSPGFDEAETRKTISAFFDRNPRVSAQVRRRMTEEALDTFARIVVNGDQRFRQVVNDQGRAFNACCKAWATGVYRKQAVRFELPDKKLESLANLAANDLFPGLVQPPGIVHNSKYGDIWNYIFCYTHVHAASDIGFEARALDYLRLLSDNQQPDGMIASIAADFKTLVHPTRFEESYIDAVYHYYKWTGDLEGVRELWPVMVRAAKWMDGYLDPDGNDLYKDTLHQWKSDFDNRGPSSSFETALVHKAYLDLAEFAKLLGHEDEAKSYSVKSERIMRAAQKQLWSREMATIGSKCPLGILRYHPECMEVDIPIWTRLADPYQSVMLADWYLANLSYGDEQGDLWLYNNDWWPVVWSTHLPAEGDMMMVAWALMLTGRYDQGCRVLHSVAGASYRSYLPGFDFLVQDNGSIGGSGDPAFCQGPFFRALVEGIFGVKPEIDRKVMVVHPRFPSGWDRARFQREGLDIHWNRADRLHTLKVKTQPDVCVEVEYPVNAPIERVLLDGKPTRFAIRPEMRHAVVLIKTKPGGGAVTIETHPKTWQIAVQKSISVGDEAVISIKGIDSCYVEDRYGFFKTIRQSASNIRATLMRQGSGQAVLFLNCRKGNIRWIEPAVMTVKLLTTVEMQRRTVDDPAPAGSSFVPMDLSQAYSDDIQTCFKHKWRWDAFDQQEMISYWTMPLFKLSESLPGQVVVGNVPFALGAMGPHDDDTHRRNILMLADTAPYELPTCAMLDVGKRKLHKFYLLSLNMNLPQKCYTPAVEVVVHYSDGTQSMTELVPPLNFDSYYQDFAANTIALPLKTEPAYGQTEWARHFGIECDRHHLTMTDVICDPNLSVSSIEFRSVSTETFFGLTGLTLLEAAN